MNIILAEKQVGPVSYCVSTLQDLYNIINSEEIWMSRESELNPKTKKKDFSVSFGRDLLAAPKRNPKRWAFGLVLDGNKLSEHYKIEPYSHAGAHLDINPDKYRVKYVTLYDDGSAVLNLVNWHTFSISSKLFQWIKEQIENLPEEYKALKKVTHQVGGKRKVNGKMIVEKYNFGTKSGNSGEYNIFKDAPGWVKSSISNNHDVDEKEERIWKNKYNKISIDGCITGIILPDIEKHPENKSDYNVILSLMDEKVGKDYDVIYY